MDLEDRCAGGESYLDDCAEKEAERLVSARRNLEPARSHSNLIGPRADWNVTGNEMK